MIRRLFLILNIFFLYTHLFALPDISGNISDETWIKENSPYHITGHTTVTNLKIESGVEVLFDGDYQFNIDGNFAALGAKNDSIYFRPDISNTNSYTGLHILPAADTVEFDYCRIESANNFAIRIDSTQTLIQNTKIINIDGTGILIEASKVEIRRSSIVNSSDNGMQIGGFGRIFLSNTQVSKNLNSGISLDDAFLSMVNCLVSYNSQGGVTLLSTADTLEFVNSTIAYHTTSYGLGSIGGTINGLNSIIYHNNQSVASGGGSINISYSNIQAPYSGSGSNNLSTDPFFDDLQSLELAANSPSIDTGNPNQEYNDICFPPSLGTPRNDMGAYGGPGACYWYDQMVVFPESLNFTNVTVNDIAELPVIVKNYRHSQLDISEIQISGPDSIYFNIDQTSASIQPFDSLIINVRFEPVSSRSYQAYLNIDQTSIPLAGQGVIPDINITPTKLDYDNVKVGNQLELSFKVTNFGQGILRIPDIQSSDSSFSIPDTILPIELPSFSNQDIFVIFKPDTNRNYIEKLLILNNDPDEDSTYLDLEGLGTAPVLNPSQAKIDFGKLMIYDTLIAAITITNTGQDTLKISDVQLIDNETNSFTLEDFFTTANIAPGSTSDSIKISYNPQTAENHSAKLQLLSNDPFSNPYEINLNGQGVKSTIDISGQNLDFGEVIVDDSLTNTIWIKNSGDTTLRIDTIKIADNINFRLADINFPFTIISHDSSDVLKITYTPKDEVFDSARLTIMSNDRDLINLDTTITGTGIIPILTTIPSDSLKFGEVAVGDSSWNTIELTNTGSGTLAIDTIHIADNETLDFHLDSLNYPIPLIADSSIILDVKFKPGSKGEKHSELIIESNSIENDSFSIALFGYGVEPQIHIMPQQIDFDTVYIGDSVSEYLDITNTGKGILRLNNILISDTLNFSYTGITAGDTLLADSSLTMQVKFHPIADFTGEKETIFRIASNDPDNAITDVSIEGFSETPVVIDLNPKDITFDSTFINAQDTARISVSNSGDFTLIVYQPEVKSGETNYSILGIEDSILIPSNQGTDFSVLFTPQIDGLIVDTLIVNSNDPLNPQQYISLSGVGIADTSEVDFTVTVSIDTLDFEASEHIFSVQIVKEGPGISSASLFLRQGGQINYEELLLTAQANDTWSTLIPTETISTRGIEYYVQARYPGGDAVAPDSGQKYPAISIIKNLYGDFQDPTLTGKYQMISLPVDAGPQNLNDLFGDNLGPYDNTKYRFFDWDPGYEEYIELTEMEAMLQPGNSLWLVTAASEELDYSASNSISSETPYSIDLHQGWNMIASPFAFNIDISSINKTPLRGEVIYEYQNSDWVPRSDSLLLPFKGYAVFAEFASTLFIPNTEAGQSMNKIPEIDEGEWHIKLMVSREQMQDSYNFAGVRSRAKNSLDRLDYPEPPKIGNFVELYFRQQDSKLTGDFRVPGNDGYLYDFVVNSNIEGESQIEAYTMNLPDEFSWEIISQTTGINYHQGPILTLAKQQDFQLVIGTNDFIENRVSGYMNKPESFQLAQNYPNPFNPETQIRFEIPQPSQISIDIFDIMGRKIKSLTNLDYYDSGYYEIKWDGRNDRGENVASGLYLLYLRSANYKKAIKMILQR